MCCTRSIRRYRRAPPDAALAGLHRWRRGREAGGALVLALLVVSHWVLDWVTHRPDLPLVPGAGPRLGLGVQWELHEEWQDDERTLGIWEAFVEDARRRMEEREEVGVP